MGVVQFSTRRPVSVFIFAVAAVVFGWVAFQRLSVDLLPDITYPSVTVRSELEGAAPTEIENLLTKPVENAVGVVNNVVRVVSSSRADVSEVTLEFAWGTNMDFASLDVRERLDVVRLPQEAEQPILLRYDPSLDPVMRIGLVGSEDLINLRVIAEEEVKRALERVEGVAAAVVSGGLEEEFQIEIDESRLIALGLDVNTLLQRLSQENVNVTGGRLLDGQTEYIVRTINEVVRPEDLRNVVIDSSQGAVTRLSEIARIRRGAKEREVITRIDGRESVEIAVYKEGGTNTVRVVDAVQERLGSLSDRLRSLDSRLELVPMSDQARYIRESVSAVLSAAVVGGALAVLVLLVFLRSVRNTLIIGISIPISVMATFFLMYAADVSLNIMSLGGLTLGIGLLVDNSIVVLEAIQRQREQGLGLAAAARTGASEVSKAVAASTLTTVCVFVPIVFVEGIAGQLFGDQALTVTFSLLVSLVVALTVIPMLASRDPASWIGSEEVGDGGRVSGLAARGTAGIVRLPVGAVRGVSRVLERATRPLFDLFDRSLAAFTDGYERLLRWVLARSLLVLGVTLLLLVASLSLARGLGRELVPELVQGEFFADVELRPGVRLEVTDRRVAGIERAAAALPEVERVFSIIGASNEQGGTAGELRENLGQVSVDLRPGSTPDQEEGAIEAIRMFVREQNQSLSRGPDGAGTMEVRFGRPSYFSFRTPVEVEIRGFNLDMLERLASRAVERMAQIEGLADIRSSTEGGNPELQIYFDRERLATFGFTIGELGDLLRTKIQGDVATDVQRQDRTIDIRVRSAESYRDSVRDLGNLNIGRGRVPIPLSSVADIVIAEGPAEIRRSDGSRVATITANVEGADLGSVAEAIQVGIGEIEFPPGFDWSLRGQQQEMEASFGSLRLALGLAIFMVYLVMASQFESLLHPLVILFSVPFSVIGAVLILALTTTPVSIVVLIGAVLLAGIVVNNAIILVDYTNQLRRGEAHLDGSPQGEGMGKIEALVAAGRVRLRPILMTTATTVLGLLPMALGLGEGSELRAPMALTVIGGLLTSTALTLLLIPAVYSLLDRRS